MEQSRMPENGRQDLRNAMNLDLEAMRADLCVLKPKPPIAKIAYPFILTSMTEQHF